MAGDGLFLCAAFGRSNVFEHFLWVFHVLPQTVGIEVNVQSFHLSVIVQVEIMSCLQAVLPSGTAAFLKPFAVTVNRCRQGRNMPAVVGSIVVVVTHAERMLFVELIVE